MNRGSDHQDIFRDQSDYQTFLMLVEKAMKRYSFELHAYCLMTNHYHMLIETHDDDIAKIMKSISECYTRHFNKKYNRDGALFRGRYTSCEVRSEGYFLQTHRYICMNPVKAHMVELPEQYPWSSYRTMLGIADDKITCKKALDLFEGGSVNGYKEFVECECDSAKDEEIARDIKHAG